MLEIIKLDNTLIGRQDGPGLRRLGDPPALVANRKKRRDSSI
jgi:hypothetical protein